MRKSNKKVRSDRINALRKQYDEFLEEDKKRKQRNDYILGRLDKMRLSTTILPLRYKINSVLESHVVAGTINQNIIGTENSNQNKKDQLLPLNVSTNNLSDNILLKEISKKYILIPKLQQVENNNNTHLQITVSPQDSVDWKRKYEILDKLKADEKEEPTYNNLHDDINNELISKNKNNKHIQQSPSPIYYDDIPEKDLTTDNLECNLMKKEPIPITKDEIEAKDIILDNKNNISNVIDNRDTYNHLDEQTENYNYNNAEINSQFQVCSEDKNDVYMQSLNPESLNVTAENAKEENRAYNEIYDNTYEANNTSNTEQEKQANVYCGEVQISADNFEKEVNNFAQANEQLINNNKVESMLNQDLNSQDSAAKHHKQLISNNPTTLQETEEYSTEPSIQNESQENVEPTIQYESYENADPSVQYESQVKAESTIQYESHENVEPSIQYESHENADPSVQYESQENAESTNQYESHIEVPAENPIVNSETETFDTQQKEMYYSEQGEYNYGTYNQDGVTYDAEYKENDNQEITDQYSYYNNEQSEGYPVETNDNEATHQQYNQMYEQQYESTPQVEQNLQEPIHYDPESYEQTQPEYDENNQGHDTIMYEQQNNEGVEQIQQQDYEQGYVEEKHIENENISTSNLEQVVAENNS